jgi:nucleotide-binding universal stress UspA family protein
VSVAAALLIWAIIVITSMVVATYLARRWGRDPFGWALLAAATGPIAVVGLAGTRQSDVARPQAFERASNGGNGGGERLLAAVDGSPAGARIARYIVELHRADIRPILLVVLRREDFQRDAAAAKTEHDARVEAATAEPLRILREAGLPASVVVGYGSPGEEIVRYAGEQGAGAIAVGRRGAGLTKALLGSVSGYVVAHARQPVVVVE